MVKVDKNTEVNGLKWFADYTRAPYHYNFILSLLTLTRSYQLSSPL